MPWRRIGIHCLVVSGCLALLVGPASAQPALERVEKLLRRPAAAQAPDASPLGSESTAKGPGYLGVVANDRTDGRPGVQIIEITPQGPAERAGLRQSDLILALNNQPIVKLDDMARLLKNQPAGAVVSFRIERNGSIQQTRVKLGERSATVAATGPRLGVRTVPVTAEVQQQLGLPDTQGAQVTAIVAGSPAEKAGVPVGVVLTALGDQAIASPETLAALVRQTTWGDAVELTYATERGPVIARLTLEPMPPAATEQRRAARPPVDLVAPADAEGPLLVQPPHVVQPPGFVPDDPEDESSPSEIPADREEVATPEQMARRIKALEQRIAELEQRIKQLEAAR